MQKHQIKNNIPNSLRLNRRVALCRTLSDPQRWLILEWLLKRGTHDPCPVGELAGQLKIADATVSHHLQQLEQAKLITRRKQGRFVYCKAQVKALAQLAGFMLQFSGELPDQLPQEPAPEWLENSCIWY